MIGRVKKWLGIEGVKLELVVPDTFQLQSGILKGSLRFQSMHSQRVTALRIVLMERYSRGRGDDRLVDDYRIGFLEVQKSIDIPSGKTVEVPFTLSFARGESNIDQLEHKLLLRGLAKIAKVMHNVSSEFRIEAEAWVEGTALNPFARKVLQVKK